GSGRPPVKPKKLLKQKSPCRTAGFFSITWSAKVHLNGWQVFVRDVACHADDVDTRRKAGYALFKMALCPRRKKLDVSFTSTRPRKSLHNAVVELVKAVHPDADIKF